MSPKEPTAETFLRDVQRHEMTVLRDDGIYRHVRFRKQQDGWHMWFDLVTWPNCLTINGDMGTWTFSRIEDMFSFFRSGKLEINPSYWAEKLQHGTHSGSDGARVWDEDSFRSRLTSQLTDHYGLEGDDLEEAKQALEDGVFNRDGKYDLLISARDFSCTLPGGRKFELDTCELPDGMEYAYNFIWCLYAIVWGIQKWDSKMAVAA